MNDLKQLLHDNVSAPPPDHLDLERVVSRGRSRVRARRTGLVAGVVATVAVLGTAGAALGGLFDTGPGPASPARQLAPVGPVLKLSDAVPAVRGTDYEVLDHHTNVNLDRANGEYYAGITDDGWVLFQDGPHGIRNTSTYALYNPETSVQDSLPDPPIALERPLDLGRDRLVFLGGRQDPTNLSVVTYDRTTHRWSRTVWDGLPRRDYSYYTAIGPDDRLYVAYAHGTGWRTFDLWSMALDDPGDVRDEHLVVGDFTIEGDQLTWTATHNEPNDVVRIRDLTTGEESSFDPRSGDRCNQLSLDRTPRYVVLGTYCGRHDGVRDDRVQVVTTDGSPVVTVRDDGAELAGTTDGDLVVRSYNQELGGTFVLDYATGRLVRISEATSRFSMEAPWAGDLFIWDTPVNGGHGATQWLGRTR
ncbi:hypothetical protein ACT8ZV_20890 [Nocardioides sp. MAHUQ-72]|uniref:hypothetical protein n=1 Tax=unclassified Nocardioides TaxID=2615069 RepID=UPI0036062762